MGATILRGSGDLVAWKEAVELGANDCPDVPSFSPLCGARLMKEGLFSWLLTWGGVLCWCSRCQFQSRRLTLGGRLSPLRLLAS